MNPITATMIVRNEAGSLRARVNRLRRHVAEVVILDQCSTDGTAALARELAEYTFQLPSTGIADPDKNLVYSLGRQPWVLSMDGDEELTPYLEDALPGLTASEEDVFWFPRVDLVEGLVMPFLGADYQPRLFRRGALAYSGQAHTHPDMRSHKVCLVPDCPILHLRSWEDVQRRNRVRNALGPEVVAKQEAYIAQVGDFLRARGKIQ